MSWKGKTRGGLTGHLIFVFILKKFGLPAAYFVLRFVSFYFVFFAPKATKSAWNYFRFAHKYNVLKTAVSVYKNFYVFGQTLLDKIASMAGVKTSFSYNFDGEEKILETLAEGKGAILISGHLGNWEIAGQMLNRLSRKVNIVMLDAEHEKIKKYLSKVMSEKNVNIIALGDDISHIVQIHNAIKNGEIICLHGDRFLPGARSVSVQFFGKNALFPEGVWHIAQRLGTPVITVFAMKETSSHYHFFASEPIRFFSKRGAEAEEAVKKGISSYANSLESMARKYPLQWFNYYDFWKQ